MFPSFAVAFLFYPDFFILSQHFNDLATTFFTLLLFFILGWLFRFAVTFLFCLSFSICLWQVCLPWQLWATVLFRLHLKLSVQRVLQALLENCKNCSWKNVLKTSKKMFLIDLISVKMLFSLLNLKVVSPTIKKTFKNVICNHVNM